MFLKKLYLIEFIKFLNTKKKLGKDAIAKTYVHRIIRAIHTRKNRNNKKF